MLRRYELTDEEWLRIEPLLPPENRNTQIDKLHPGFTRHLVLFLYYSDISRLSRISCIKFHCFNTLSR